MENLKIKKLTETATIPARGSDGAAGYDLYADSIEGDVEITENKNGTRTAHIPSGRTVKIHTGIAMAIPEGNVGLVFARSGLATKQGLRPANCVGVIDEDYRGEIIVVLYGDVDYSKWLKKESKKNEVAVKFSDFTEQFANVDVGDRVAQIVFVPYKVFNVDVVDELDATVRGEGGFGSTGTD